MGIKRLTIRLNPDKERDREIIFYIETFDKKELRTMNNAVLNAVYEFLKSKNKAHSEKSKTVISDIIPEIRKAISEELSKFILPLVSGLITNRNTNLSDNQNGAQNTLDPDNADMDFLGG